MSASVAFFIPLQLGERRKPRPGRQRRGGRSARRSFCVAQGTTTPSSFLTTLPFPSRRYRRGPAWFLFRQRLSARPFSRIFGTPAMFSGRFLIASERRLSRDASLFRHEGVFVPLLLLLRLSRPAPYIVPLRECSPRTISGWATKYSLTQAFLPPSTSTGLIEEIGFGLCPELASRFRKMRMSVRYLGPGVLGKGVIRQPQASDQVRFFA